MKTNYLYVTLLTLFLTACATTEKYEAILNTWVGASVNDLVSSWGYPQESFQAPNGNMVYVYSKSMNFVMPTQTTSRYDIQSDPLYGLPTTVYGNTTTTGGQTLSYSCRTFFEVNQSKKIVSWRWEGNNCRA